MAVRGWTHTTGLEPREAARQSAASGVARLLCTAIDRDGTLTGPDLELLRANRIAGYVSVALGACLVAIATVVPLGPPIAIAVGIAASAAMAGLAIGISRCARD